MIRLHDGRNDPWRGLRRGRTWEELVDPPLWGFHSHMLPRQRRSTVPCAAIGSPVNLVSDCRLPFYFLLFYSARRLVWPRLIGCLAGDDHYRKFPGSCLHSPRGDGKHAVAFSLIEGRAAGKVSISQLDLTRVQAETRHWTRPSPQDPLVRS